jgi:hypothetical protein
MSAKHFTSESIAGPVGHMRKERAPLIPAAVQSPENVTAATRRRTALVGMPLCSVHVVAVGKLIPMKVPGPYVAQVNSRHDDGRKAVCERIGGRVVDSRSRRYQLLKEVPSSSDKAGVGALQHVLYGRSYLLPDGLPTVKKREIPEGRYSVHGNRTRERRRKSITTVRRSPLEFQSCYSISYLSMPIAT